MNRRRFLQAGAMLPVLLRPGAAQPRTGGGRPVVPDLVRRALTAANSGFPSVVPLFAGVLAPAHAAAHAIEAESWADLVSQAGQAAGSYQIACFTAIRNMNRTWCYAALQPGAPTYFFHQSASAPDFLSTFQSKQAAYTMVDFNVTWQDGQLIYSGCWAAQANPAPQTLLLDIATSITGLQAQAKQFQSTMQMTRLQAYPLKGEVAYAALYRSGQGSGQVHDMTFPNFESEVTTLSGNTLAGIGYNSLSGHLVGTWQSAISGATFFVDQSWADVQSKLQAAPVSLIALAAYPDAPDFDDYFEANLGPFVMGYGYAVARDGDIIASGGGYARSTSEALNPGTPFTADTALTLASVSKAIAGVALEKLAMQKGWSLDMPFLPLLNGKASNPAQGVEAITLRNLATMQSGLPPDDTPSGEGPAELPSGETIWDVINNYLSKPPSGAGVTYYYDNTNYTILQAVIEEQSATDYVTYVTQNVLMPAGMDPSLINTNPVRAGTPTTLTYSGPEDTAAGYQRVPIALVGTSGWVSPARELVKLLAALRGDSVLPQTAVTAMFSGSIGWNLPGNSSGATAPQPYQGALGTYYWKEGGLTHNGQALRRSW